MRLAVIGTGLMGCSFAAAARAAGQFDHIVGIDPSHGARAQALGFVDTLAQEPPLTADAILIATPADQIVGWLERLQHHQGIIFDVGSVKGALITSLKEKKITPPVHFIPCHPIAGSERSGPDAAQPDMFQDRLLVITPLPDTDAAALAQITTWWQQLGAQVQQMSPQEHDRIFALTSHLPHLAAFAYMQLVADEDLVFAAGGFRDFSRIAASDPDMWVPILQLNREAILASLDELQQALSDLGQLIETGDTKTLHAKLAQARERRRRFLSR